MLLRIGIALIALGVIGGIAGAIIWGWDGPDRDRTIEYRVVNEDGTPVDGDQRVVVIDDDRDGRRFFPFFPLVIVGGVLVTIALVTRGRHHWGGPHGHFDEWHRQAHQQNGPEAPPASS